MVLLYRHISDIHFIHIAYPIDFYLGIALPQLVLFVNSYCLAWSKYKAKFFLNSMKTTFLLESRKKKFIVQTFSSSSNSTKQNILYTEVLTEMLLILVSIF